MANRHFPGTPKTLNHSVVEIDVVFDVGATGAPTLKSSPYNEGVSSISRSTNGTYLVTLQDKYYGLLGGGGFLMEDAVGDQDLYLRIDDESIQSAGTFVIKCMTGTTPTDPASGTDVHFTVRLLNAAD